MISFQYELHSYRQFLEDFAKQLEIPFSNNRLYFPEHIGEGYMQLIELPDGLEAMISDFKLKKDLLLERSKDHFEYYTLICEEIANNSELTLQIEKEKLELEQPYSSIYLTSFLYDVSYLLKKNSKFSGIRILLNADWMQQYLCLEHNKLVLEQYLELKTAGALSKPFDAEIRMLLQELLTQKREPVSLLFYQTRILRIIEKFCDWLHFDQAKLPAAAATLSKTDIDSIIKVENLLAGDLHTPPPTIPELARAAAMSESKLKKLFKTMYGSPPYEYYQKQRMTKARQLLLTGEYTIKDVGYALGYVNLSNFTLAFKKEFGYLPSDLLK
jgi:AraC-like DNA-binding protein